jgi:hypothetical protein
MPQYVLLIHTPVQSPPADDPGMQISRWIDYGQSLHDAGVHVADERLDRPEVATTVRVRDGETLITDGPFAETNEYLAGYYVIDTPDLDTALAHAARVPNVHYAAIEVRPVLTLP